MFDFVYKEYFVNISDSSFQMKYKMLMMLE